MKRRVVLQGGAVLLLGAGLVFLGGSLVLSTDEDQAGWRGPPRSPRGSDARGSVDLDAAARVSAEAPSPEGALPPLPLGAVVPADPPEPLVEAPDPSPRPGPDAREVVIRRGGQPLAGVRLRLYRQDHVGGRALFEGHTDAQGRLALAPQTDGDALVAVAEAPGLAPEGLRVPAGQTELDLDLRDLVPGRVVGPAGEGVAARVRLLLGAFVLSETTASPSGDYRLPWPRELVGTLALEVSAEGYHPARLELQDSSALAGVQLRRGDTGGLRGLVVDERGQPVPEVLVRAMTSERSPAVAQTDREGRFVLPALRAGPVDLEVYLEDPLPITVTTALVAAGVETPVRIEAHSPGLLRVLVRDGTGEVEGADVRIVDPTTTRFGGFSTSGAEQRHGTDESGRTWFALPSGRYYVRVRYRGQEASAEAQVAAGEESEVQVDLTQSRALRVRVVDVQGVPLAGVFMDVSMPSIQWQSMPSGTTGEDGVVEFPSLPAGLAGVHVGLGGQWRMVYTEAEAADLVWTEVSQLRVLGNVEGVEGQVLAASVLPDTVKMEALELRGGLLDAELSPPDGERDVYLLAPDAHLAPAFVGHAGLGQPELIPPTLRFEPAATVRGQMVAAEGGAGIPGEVRLEGPLGGVLEARAQWLGGTDHDPWITVNEWGQSTGSDGSFELGGLPPGTHTVTLRGLGCRPRSLQLTVEAGVALELGVVELESTR